MKYLLNGQCVNVVQKLENGKYLVENIYCESEEFYGEEANMYIDRGNTHVVDKVFDKVPTEKYHDEIQALTETIRKLNETHRKVSDNLSRINTEHVERVKKLKKYKALQRLEDFIDGKITHYAILCSYRPEVIKFGDTKSEYSRDKLKLLTLFGNTEGNLEWGLNCYSDGSGSNETVVPCISEDEAKIVLKDFMYKYCTETNGNKDWTPSLEAIKKAQSFGAEIPEELIANVKAKELESLKKSEEKAEETYKKARKRRLEFK